jgi:hypothetical protein
MQFKFASTFTPLLSDQRVRDICIHIFHSSPDSHFQYKRLAVNNLLAPRLRHQGVADTADQLDS